MFYIMDVENFEGIRRAIKKALPDYKLSVKRDFGRMIIVRVMSGPLEQVAINTADMISIITEAANIANNDSHLNLILKIGFGKRNKPYEKSSKIKEFL